MPDHVHILAGLSAVRTIADVMRIVKTNSSKWVRETFSEAADFSWQVGYAAFTVSVSNLAGVRRYIENQEEHHHSKTFQEEFRSFLDQHGIEYDERYLWD